MIYLNVKCVGMYNISVLLTLLFITSFLLLCGDIHSNPGPSNVCSTLKICHVNIRSLSRSKLLAIQEALASFYDVITVSETHLHLGVCDDIFKLKGFHDIIRRDRGANGGGIAIFVKEHIQYKRIFKYDNPDLESMWISIKTLQGNILVCCCYRPPDKSDFWEEFSDTLNIVKSDQFGRIFILGDLNADFNTVNGRKLKQLCQLQNLKHMISEPTRITAKTSSILDQVLTNSPFFIKGIKVTPPISTNDHCTVGITLNFKIKKDPAYKRTIWDYKNANFDVFRRKLQETNFDNCFDSNDIDVVCTNWTNLFLQVAMESVPNKVVTIRPNDSPWYTNELRKMKRKMQKLFYKYKGSKLQNDWNNYSKARNDYKNGLDNAESNYKKSLASSLSENKNSKSWWTTVKWLLGKGGESTYPHLNDSHREIYDSKEKAKVFNNFFLSHSNIDDSKINLPDTPCECNLDSILASEDEVLDLLKCIDTSKATGPDGISPKLLHEAGASIVPSLTKLINLSLTKCKVPKDWKLANVIPLFKKGDKHNTNNYRPVSLLSCVNKILERIVFKHLYNYLRDKKLLSKDQSGFQTGDSTINQLSYMYHFLCKALDEKKEVHIVFCDISKAFDRVSHKGLIYKLKNLGIGGSLLLWFIDYLHDRHQRVIIKGQQSEYGVIKAGVPQGSILGPLLFLIYINDITLVTQTKMKLFADDTSIYIDFDNAESASTILNNDMVAIQNWADQWLVKFSPPKTKLLTCSFKNNGNYPPVKFNDVILQKTDSHKHLGITLSSNLSWNVHIENIIQNVAPMSDVLKKLKYDLDRYSLERCYFSFIRPKLEYGSIIWDNCSNLDKDKLENIQLDIARVVTGARKGTSHELIYKETNWLKLSERRNLHKLKKFSKIIEGKEPEYLQEIIPKKKSLLSLRNSDNIPLIKCRTEKFKSSFLPSSIATWNTYPADNRSSSDFDKKLKSSCNPLFYLGSRSNNVKLAQLRMNCSKLNEHLFLLHVVDSPRCACGFGVEDTAHFLLQCPLYHTDRQELVQSLQEVGIFNFDVNTLLFGDDNYSYILNSHIVNFIHKFIEKTGRL